MFTTLAERPRDWETCNVYAIADLHIGDPTANADEIAADIEKIQNDPRAVVILNGDLMNTATRSSVSDVYGETMKPSKQLEFAADLLEPIATKIVAAASGNHENRVYKSDGIDMTRLLCRELGREYCYSPDGVLCFLKFGRGAPHGGRQPSLLTYTIYATHGGGCGRKEGGKANRLADMGAIVDADVYIHSHTHLPMILKEDFYRVDVQNANAVQVTKLFVNTSAKLRYGGYGQAAEFKPSACETPVVHLSGRKKQATATL